MAVKRIYKRRLVGIYVNVYRSAPGYGRYSLVVKNKHGEIHFFVFPSFDQSRQFCKEMNPIVGERLLVEYLNRYEWKAYFLDRRKV